MSIHEVSRRPSEAALTEALRRHLGHPCFRPGQEDLVRAALEGRDALGILPTGGGKSVCFQLPAFLLDGLVLVISPLISLMEDQVGRAAQAGLRVGVLNTNTPPPTRRRLIREGREGRLQLLFVSPERLQVRSFFQALQDLPLRLIAIDEAHCISMWGRDFRPAYLKIGDVRSVTRAPILALTATATPEVRADIEGRLRLRNPVRVVGSFDRPNLFWSVRKAESFGQKLEALRGLLSGRTGATIVYASTRKTVEAVRRSLASFGTDALPYHAGLPAGIRTWVQDRFLSDPKPLVVATNAFGMGIDRPDVRLVVHAQLPGSLEAYYQEAGRAGRDGLPALCVALHGKRDRKVHDRFIAGSYPAEWKIRDVHRALLRRMGPDREVTIDPEEVRRALGRNVAMDEALSVLNALVRSGAIIPHEDGGALFELESDGRSGPDACPGPDGRFGPDPLGPPGGTRSRRPPDPLRLWIRLRSPRLVDLRRLRRAEEAKLGAVLAYAGAGGCRRSRILAYFGEQGSKGPCGRCDRCRSPGIKNRHPGFSRETGLFGTVARR